MIEHARIEFEIGRQQALSTVRCVAQLPDFRLHAMGVGGADPRLPNSSTGDWNGGAHRTIASFASLSAISSASER